MDSREYALLAAEAAAEKKAGDIVVLGVAELLVVTDYFVIATGNTDRQVKAIADEVVERLKTAGLRPVGIEGEREARWILVDFIDVVVHVFRPEQREFYRLEKLWSDAERVPLPEEIAEDARA
ncbi:MAG: ribosome silencing factor [Coriobacteriaceae bacterium]|nr:ribosome silencing factor [Coriobacteriaceae bacterium]